MKFFSHDKEGVSVNLMSPVGGMLIIGIKWWTTLRAVSVEEAERLLKCGEEIPPGRRAFRPAIYAILHGRSVFFETWSGWPRLSVTRW